MDKKTFLCVESGEYFLLDAIDFKSADLDANLWNGNCIRELSTKEINSINNYNDLEKLVRG
jgi:hypothetical protein